MERKTRYIPSIIMLAAAFVACIMSIYYNYTTKETLFNVLCTLVVFFVIGIIIKLIADKCLIVSMEAEIENESKDDGEETDFVEDKDSKGKKNEDIAPKKT